MGKYNFAIFSQHIKVCGLPIQLCVDYFTHINYSNINTHIQKQKIDILLDIFVGVTNLY